MGRIGSFEWNVGSDVIYWSDELFRIHDLVPQSEVITPDRVDRFIHPDDLGPLQLLKQHSLQEPGRYGLRHRMIRPDGAQRWLRHDWESFADTGGTVYRVTGTVQDVTEQTEAQQRIARSEKLLRATEAAAHTGSYELHVPTGHIIFSEGMFRLFGESPDAFEPSLAWIDNHSHPDDVAPVRAVLDKAIATLQPYTYRRRIVRRDGAWRTVEAHGVVVGDPSGTATRLVGLVQDITERLAAEAGARRQQALLEATINSSLDMIQVFRAVRDEAGALIDFEWTLINDTSRSYMGEVTGKRLLALQPGVVEEGIFDALCDVVETGIPKAYEKHYVHEQFDGWFYQSVVKLDDGVATTTSDISGVKRTEQELHSTKEFLQTTLDSTLNVVQAFEAVRDEAGNIVDFTWRYTNRRWKEEHGTEMTGKRLLAENPGVLETGLFDDFVRVTESGVPVEREMRYTHEQFNGWFFQTIARLEDGFVMTTVDITGRKKSEAEIAHLKEELAQKATDRYRVLFDSIREGLAVCGVERDPSGVVSDLRYLELNAALEQQSGLKQEALLGRKLSDVLAGAEFDRWIARFRGAVDSGGPQSFEECTERLGRWYSVSVYPKQDELLIFYNDITGRRQRELRQAFLLLLSDQLRAEPTAEAVARRALHLLTGHLGLDHSYIVSYDLEANSATLEYQVGNGKVPALPGRFDLSEYPEAFKAILEQTLVIGDDAERRGLSAAESAASARLGMRAMIAATVRQGERNPAWSLVAVSAQPRSWTAGEVALVEEVAERTWTAIVRAQGEEALRQSQQKYSAAFNAIEESFCILELLRDADGQVYDLVIREENPALYKHTGLSGVVGKRMKEVMPRLESVWIEKFAEVAATGIPQRLEDYNQDTGRWYHVQFLRVGDAGSNLVASVFADITERRQQEQRELYLVRLNDLLRSTFDAVDLEEKVTALAMEQFGSDRCYYCSVEGGEAVIRRDARKEGSPSVAGTYPLSDFKLFRQVIDAAAPLVVTDASGSPVLDEDLRRLCLQFGIISFIDVPVMKNGLAKGILCVVHASPRHWTQPEIDLAVETAERLWAAAERARAEEALRASEKRFHSIANLVPDLLWDSEPDGSTTWLSGRWIDYTGQRFEEAIGWGWVHAIHPDDREGAARRYRQAVAAATALRQEYRIRRSDGVYRWFVVTALPVLDDNGTVLKIYGAATDIHDRKVAEEVLQQSEARLRITMESATDYAIITMDQERRIEKWSSGATHIFGWEPAEVIGRPGDLIFTEEDRAAGAPEHEMETARATGRAADERWHRRKDGSRFYASGVLRPIQDHGVAGYVKVLRDVTEQQLFTEQLHALVTERTRELQRSNDSLQQFASIAAHDLQEPLRKLRMFANILRKRFAPTLPGEAQDLLGKLSVTTDRMRQLIQEVLQYSRVSNDRSPLRPINLEEILQAVLSDLDLLLSEKGATVRHPAPLPAIPAVALQMNQLFYNLLTNALKFSREGAPR